MEAIMTKVEFVEINAEAADVPTNDAVTELNDLKLAMVGGGAGDINF